MFCRSDSEDADCVDESREGGMLLTLNAGLPFSPLWSRPTEQVVPDSRSGIGVHQYRFVQPESYNSGVIITRALDNIT
jgi:hypothetical protein